MSIFPTNAPVFLKWCSEPFANRTPPPGPASSSSPVDAYSELALDHVKGLVVSLMGMRGRA